MADNKNTVKRLQKIFEGHHGKVWADTDICKRWRQHHTDCKGCKHIKQCKALNNWILSIFDGHEPNEFLDKPLDYNSEDYDPPADFGDDPYV